MTLQDVAGVLSRYFIVGFFVPTLAGFVVLDQTLSSSIQPQSYVAASGTTQILILGGTALVAALALSGLHEPILHAFQGYPLEHNRERPVFRWLYARLTTRRRTEFRRLEQQRKHPKRSVARTLAASRLETRFPPAESALLPTRFGNTVRAFQFHAYRRWGLDTVAIWPRIEMLLSQEEMDLHATVKGDVAFFLNACLVSIAVGLLLIIDAILFQVPPWFALPLYGIPFLVAVGLYRAAVSAAVRWGDAVRSSMDLHRRDLYERIGAREPTGDADEKQLARAINRCILYADALPDTERRSTAKDPNAPTS